MLRRLLALIRKELQIVLGDRRSWGTFITPVIMQTILFPFAAVTEVRNATVAIYNQDTGPASIEIIQRLSHTAAFTKVNMVHGEPELRQQIDGQKALLAVSIPPDFSRKVDAREKAPVQVLLDGRRSNSSQLAGGYVNQVVSAYAAERTGSPRSGPTIRHLYNPNLQSIWHVLPSLVAIITTIGCLTVTALSVAREREDGTFDQLLVSPLTPGYIMAGKAIPGIAVAFTQGIFIIAVSRFIFGVPFSGSTFALFLGLLFYGMALAGVGLYISSISMTQQQAFFGVFTFMTPAVMLSGYVSPVENMPWVLRMLSKADPLSHLIIVVKGTFLKGYGLPEVWPHLWPLLIIATCTLSIALYFFRRHIA